MNHCARVDHAHAASALREQPGTWLPVGEYRNALTASSIARLIRTTNDGKAGATGRFYEPAGAFEARTRLTDEGTVVEARYVGDRRSARPDRVRPSLDTERVLGQIERGEIRCGADAAREIAARHQAEYGDAVWPDLDSTWAAALTSVSGGNLR